jgi:acyl-CoA thioesterase FadM
MAIKVTRMYDGSLVAKARKSFVQYDYRSNRSISFNNDVKEALNQSPFEL